MVPKECWCQSDYVSVDCADTARSLCSPSPSDEPREEETIAG